MENKNKKNYRKKKQSLLSKTQSKRLGGLIQVLGNTKPLDEIVDTLQALKMVVEEKDCLMVTEKGLDETNRLSTLAGLMTDKKKESQ
jgi:hypothetical protein|tara:strand:+ start:60 stop:320 length:261 start_codon:yes stop_codon:yes gene_type:complete